MSAKDRATNNEQKITITSSSGLSKDEVEKMAKDAEAHSGEDRQRKEQIEARNQLDSMVYSTEKMLSEHRAKISDADAKNVETAIQEAKDAVKDGSLDKIREANNKLTQASHKLAEAMYASASQPGADAGAGTGAGSASSGSTADAKPDDNVVDAEFVDVDEKK